MGPSRIERPVAFGLQEIVRWTCRSGFRDQLFGRSTQGWRTPSAVKRPVACSNTTTKGNVTTSHFFDAA